MVLIKYVTHNLGRKKKQTLFSLLCIAVSSLIVLADFALVNGIEAGLKRGINEVMSGQLTVYCSENDKMNILESQLTDQIPFAWTAGDLDKLNRDIPGLVVNERVRIGSLVSYADETSYMHFHALQDGHLQRVESMLAFSSGRMPVGDTDIIVSETMAKDLKCAVGDTLLLVAGNIHDYMTDAVAVVSGIFLEQGLAIYLSHSGFMKCPLGRELAGIGDEDAVELILNPAAGGDFDPGELAAIRQWFADGYPSLRLATWERTVPLLHSIVKVWNGGGMMTQVVFILFSLIILVTLTSLVIHSRRKEIGTLLAIGFSWNRVRLLVTAEYALLSFIAVGCGCMVLLVVLATALGCGVAITSQEMQAALMTDRLHLFITPSDVLYVLLLFVLTTVTSALISIRRLRKIRIQSLINN